MSHPERENGRQGDPDCNDVDDGTNISFEMYSEDRVSLLECSQIGEEAAADPAEQNVVAVHGLSGLSAQSSISPATSCGTQIRLPIRHPSRLSARDMAPILVIAQSS